MKAEIYPIKCRLTGPRGPVKTYLLVEADEIVLIDAGSSVEDAQLILAHMDRLKIRPQMVKLCIITHKHSDHIGGMGGEGLKTLREVCGFKIACHELEAQDIERQTGLKADVLLRDNQELDMVGGLRILHVPGHTSGNICVYVKRNRNLIAGDAIFSAGGWLIPPPQYLCEDPRLAKEALKKLLKLDVKAVLVAHGQNASQDGNLLIRLIVAENRQQMDLVLRQIN